MKLLEAFDAMRDDPRIERAANEVAKLKAEIEAANEQMKNNADWVQKQFEKLYGKRRG